jgi:hypothetical protein
VSRRPKPLNPDASWSCLFGATVRRLRLGIRSSRPLTQAELGKQIGYSDATVGAVERAALRPDLVFMEGCERVLPADGSHPSWRPQAMGGLISNPGLSAMRTPVFPGGPRTSRGQVIQGLGKVRECPVWRSWWLPSRNRHGTPRSPAMASPAQPGHRRAAPDRSGQHRRGAATCRP